MQEEKRKNIPKHFREYKYQQNREVSPGRQEEKDKRREERNEAHKEILADYKLNHKYFDKEADEWNKQKYYMDLPEKPTYEQLNALLSSTFHHAKRR